MWGADQLLYLLISSLVISADGLILPSLLFGQGAVPLTACQVQAYLKVVGDFSEIIWTNIILLACYISVCKEGGLQLVTRLEWLIILAGYGLPFGLAIWPLAADMLGPTAYICWFKPKNSSISAMVVCYYAPLWLSFLTNILLVALIQARIRKESGGERNAPLRVFFYPVILLLVGLFSTIHRVYYMVTGNDIYILNLLDETFFSAWGIMVVLVYVLTPDTLARIKRRLHPEPEAPDRNDTDSSCKPIEDMLIFQELQAD